MLATAWKDVAESLHKQFEDGKARAGLCASLCRSGATQTPFALAAARRSPRSPAPQAYYVTNGQLKPANKQYSSTSFAYELSLTENTKVEPCTDVELKVTNTSFNFAPFDSLVSRLSSKALIDVLGVVTGVSELSAVLRKKDNASLQKRELTLLDSTCKTVRLTLWGELAEKTGAELASLPSPVVAFKAIRLGDYNGVSLSSLEKTVFVLEPQGASADALRAWYAAEGRTAATTEAGAGLTGSGTPGGGGKASRKSLADIQDAPLASSDAKPEWALLTAVLIHIPPDGSLYYTACPEEGCNKKVVQEAGGQWRCEAMNRSFAECRRRYILRFKLADSSAAGYVNAFDDQGKQIFGCSADELHAEKEADSGAYLRRLKRATWMPWVVKTKSATDSYNGEQRRRITVASLAKPDWVQESAAIAQQLGAA